MQFDKQVKFDSFWLRLHRSPVVFLDKAQGPRTVWVYSQGQLVAETTFLLRSDEWYLIKPSSANSFVGDTLVVSELTDIDNIVISWGDAVKGTDKKHMTSSNKLGQFTAFHIQPTPNQKNKYSANIANVKVPSSKQKAHDSLIPEKV